MTVGLMSPGIEVREIDLTTIIPSVSTTEGALAGTFRWGPVNEPILVTSEVELVKRFGKPKLNWNVETFFVAADFLSYTDALYISRASDGAKSFGEVFDSTSNSDLKVFESIYPGDMGNAIEIHVMDQAGFYNGNPNVLLSVATVVGFNINDQVSQVTSGGTVTGVIESIDVTNKILEIRITSTVVKQFIRDALITHVPTSTTFVPFDIGVADYTVFVDRAPVLGDYHVLVVDVTGAFTGVPGAILEKYQDLSTDPNAKTDDGTSLYFINAINRSSQYIQIPETLDNQAGWPNFFSGYQSIRLSGGTDGNGEETISAGVLQDAWMVFESAEDIDISIILAGKARPAIQATGANHTYMANWLIDNIAHRRKDVVVCVSPNKETVVNNVGSELQDITVFKTGRYPGSQVGVQVGITSSSYAIVDSGYKYRYDKYNDAYVWVPLNGDIGGLLARTDDTNDPWWSPAGYNRGIIKNVVKLAYNPTRTSERDQLYKMGVNPVFVQVGIGPMLFGDKTALMKPSAFDRINVRRLFIVLEKAIAKASRYFLFEFNDAFTRAQFVNTVEPYLRDIQGRRGIYDFHVVCNETNNTPEVIDRNEFIGDIYIKPARSINFIQLNFIAVRTGVEFSEIIGKTG